jgi:hypothetical protein
MLQTVKISPCMQFASSFSIQACKINIQKYEFVYSTTNNGLTQRRVMQVFCTADNKAAIVYSMTHYMYRDRNKLFLTFETSYGLTI